MLLKGRKMNRNRKLLIPERDKSKIHNRHERKLRRERKVAYAMAIIVLAILVAGIIGQMILIGGAN